MLPPGGISNIESFISQRPSDVMKSLQQSKNDKPLDSPRQ